MRKETNRIAYCLYIGLFAGLIWGLVRWLAVAMNLTEVQPAFLADPWVKRTALAHAGWQAAGLFLFVLMSVVAAFVYYVLFRLFWGPVPGLVFGVGWWAVFYLGLGPIIGAVPPLRQLGWNSIVTDLCLFTMWGLFIGYSMAYEFHDEWSREPEPAAT